MTEFQKFSEDELNTLRDELRRAGLDSFHADELLRAFLSARGYGASIVDARDAAARIEPIACCLPMLQAQLEHLARIM